MNLFQKWSDCTMVKRARSHPLGVCTNYHFYPNQREADLFRVFNAIMTGRIGDIWKFTKFAQDLIFL